MLELTDVTVKYGSFCAAHHISFSLSPGQWLMLAGPNGAGKSTLIEAISGGVPYSGRILLDGTDVRRFTPARLAREIGVLSQKNTVGYAYTVEEVVSLGRYAHRHGFLNNKSGDDEELIDRALRLTGLTQLKKADVLTLSGGEMQRVFLAQVFAQDPRILILDEPTNHLDLKYQQQIFGLIREWLGRPGRAVLSIVHDLSLIRRYGTHAVLLNEGHCMASGTVQSVMTPDNLNSIYGMDVGKWMRESLSLWLE